MSSLPILILSHPLSFVQYITFAEHLTAGTALTGTINWAVSLTHVTIPLSPTDIFCFLHPSSPKQETIASMWRVGKSPHPSQQNYWFLFDDELGDAEARVPTDKEKVPQENVGSGLETGEWGHILGVKEGAWASREVQGLL